MSNKQIETINEDNVIYITTKEEWLAIIKSDTPRMYCRLSNTDKIAFKVYLFYKMNEDGKLSTNPILDKYNPIMVKDYE